MCFDKCRGVESQPLQTRYRKVGGWVYDQHGLGDCGVNKQERVMSLTPSAFYEHTSRRVTRQHISLPEGGANSTLGLEEGRDAHSGAMAYLVLVTI